MGKIDTLTTTAPSAPARDEIVFPFADYPEAGTATEVADGIFWISTTVPFVALKQVNLWLLRDGPGWTMIDCGYGKPAVREQLMQTWESVLGGRPVTRLIVTHFHPDHAGNSGFIADHWNLRPLMSQGEWFTANLAHADKDTDAIKPREDFYRRHGLSEAQIGVTLPHDYKRLRNGNVLTIGNDRWQVVIGEGHSPEHVSLYCAERRILIAGDQILPAITTNVSTWPGEPEFDAVGAFLGTCKKFLDLLDHDTFILPSHRKPFFNVRRRLRDLAVHHADRLNLILDGAGRETSAGKLIDVLFRSGLDGHQVGFAMGEIIAHLNHLVVLGHMQMIETRSQVRYRRVSDDEAKVAPHFSVNE
jgi:glyoxylase-like metal-dependent hydrolase (beta-lactamase superfamily II)